MGKTKVKTVTKENKVKSTKDKNKESKESTILNKKEIKPMRTPSFVLSGRKRCWPSYFHDIGYIHMKDNFNQKTFSLNTDEMKLLVKYVPKLEKHLRKLELSEQKSDNRSKEVSPEEQIEDSTSADSSSAETDSE